MKVLLLTTHLNIGGIGAYTVNLANYLRKEDVEVIVVSSGGDLVRSLSDNGIKHIYLDIKTKSELSLKVWKAVPLLKEIISEENVRIIHAQTRVTQFLSYLVKKKINVPFVTTCHGFFRYKKLFRRLFPCWGESTIAISKSVREHLINDFGLNPENVELVYNGIELERFRNITEEKSLSLMSELNVPGDVMVVGAIGRLSVVKGYKYLISAFKEALSVNNAIYLLLVGDGPEKEALSRQIEDYGIEDKVLMTPGSEKIGEYLSLMDIFCLPSLNEGLGLSLMEAMASGRACIASNAGGLSELISEGNDGLFVSPGSVDELKKAILKLLDNKELRRKFSENARKKAYRDFSIKNCINSTIAVYRKLI